MPLALPTDPEEYFKPKLQCRTESVDSDSEPQSLRRPYPLSEVETPRRTYPLSDVETPRRPYPLSDVETPRWPYPLSDVETPRQIVRYSLEKVRCVECVGHVASRRNHEYHVAPRFCEAQFLCIPVPKILWKYVLQIRKCRPDHLPDWLDGLNCVENLKWQMKVHNSLYIKSQMFCVLYYEDLLA